MSDEKENRACVDNLEWYGEYYTGKFIYENNWIWKIFDLSNKINSCVY